MLAVVKLALSTVFVASFATHAVAEPAAVQFSAPVVIGATSVGGTSFAATFRPELVVATHPGDAGVGIGGYAEVATLGGQHDVGAGITAVRYFGFVGLAPSVGVYTGNATGVSASLLFGPRASTRYHLDLASGLRVDGHLDRDGTTTVTAGVSFDTVVVVGLIHFVTSGFGISHAG
jgi:hypothetical protein